MNPYAMVLPGYNKFVTTLSHSCDNLVTTQQYTINLFRYFVGTPSAASATVSANASAVPIKDSSCTCDTFNPLVAGVTVAVSVPIASIITAIISSIMTYWCMKMKTYKMRSREVLSVSRPASLADHDYETPTDYELRTHTSTAPADYETPTAHVTVDMQHNAAYGYYSGGSHIVHNTVAR